MGLTTDWLTEAACLGHEPELFFPVAAGHGAGLNPAAGPQGGPEHRRQVEAALKVCAACPVRQRCLREALAAPHVHGVWGGKTAEEREELLRQRPAEEVR